MLLIIRLLNVFQYLPCWEGQWSSWAGLLTCFLQRKFQKMHWKEKFLFAVWQFNPIYFSFLCEPSPRCCLCIHAASLPRSPHGTVWVKTFRSVTVAKSVYIIHPRMYRKCPKTWQAAWLMPLGGGNWMNKWYSLSFCNFFGGKRGQTLAKVRRRMI